MTAISTSVLPRDPLFKLSVAQYHEMIDRGILTDEDPVELLEGLLITKMPKNPPHVLAADLVAEQIIRLLPPGWHVRRQDPITTSDSEPEPDVSVVRGDRRDFAVRHPGPNDLALVVEVADTTLERDRTMKGRAYSRAGIETYWIVNLPDRCIEVYTNPKGEGPMPAFQSSTRLDESSSVALRIDGRDLGPIAVRSVLP